MSESLEARLRRLEQERDEADRRYNEALTDLDRAVPRLGGIADPEPAIDEHQLATLNEAWNILPAPPAGSGLKGKLAAFVWRTVAPYLQRQLTFNSVLVDHINRTTDAQRRSHQRAVEHAAALRAQLDALTAFHARFMVYLQQITAYVDTKDRQMGGGALVLNAALSDVAEGQAKYRESFAAREARMNAALAGQDELRAMLGVAQQAIASLKRHMESALRGPQSAVRGAEPAALAPSLDAYKYVGFEDQFRGSQDVIRARQESYLPFFEAGRQDGLVTGDVLDVGCGRGEFIDLLNTRGIPARGIDLNSEMVAVCRARGLNVTEADAVGYLEAQADASFGGIFAAQVVEHLEPAYLLRFLDLAFMKLQPGGTLVLETLNPACWTAFFESYIRDITHRWPLHPDTLKYLVMASGFTKVSVEFRSPVPEHERLQPIASGDAELVETFNENVRKLNARMFTHMDYAVVAVKA
ncbi:MAG TPA: class I SAM-dependent methyltransferase [Vicinamibacterales bacterium]